MNELKAQLKKEEEEREKCEQELASMDNKIKLLEESLDKAEENLSQTTSKLNDIETVCDRFNRFTKNNCLFFRVPGTLKPVEYAGLFKLTSLESKIINYDS